MSAVPGWPNGTAPIPTLSGNLIPALSQWQTNGGSTLGTLDFAPLPRFLEGPRRDGCYPWGNVSVYTADTSYPPNTGVTRYYDLTVTNETLAPDGFSMPVLAVNGQYPAPMIEANWGDWIEVKLTNHLETEGTSMHWHGLLQRDTPWYDGVPGLTQCPIAPNNSFTYRFRADQPGSTWYHSHYSAQYVGAIQGPLVIHGPTSADYDIDLGPLLMNDWFHDNYYDLVAQTMAPNVPGGAKFFYADSILLNGKMNYNCSLLSTVDVDEEIAPGYTCTNDAGVAKFRFQSGKRHLLRLANTGAESIIKFSIDGHKMTVISVDFTPTQPYTVDVVTLIVGQRAEVIVEATGQPTDAVWMRAGTSPNCSDVGGIYLTGLAAVFYEDADPHALPTSISTVVSKEVLDVCDNDALDTAIPAFNYLADAGIDLAVDEPDITLDVRCTLGYNGTHNVWYINNSTFRDNYNDPLLLDAKLGPTAMTNVSSQRNLYNLGHARSVRLVIYNYMSLASHPMHLHGHNFWVLATGEGEWDGSVGTTSNPQRRDTANVRKSVTVNTTAPENDYLGTPSYVVIQYIQDNPGVWPLHCHIAWHVSDGFLMNILERPDDIQNEMQIPGVMAQTCRDWAAWTGGLVVPMIDAGL